MSDWLKKQLTDNKKSSGMWNGLAEILQKIFSQHVDPVLARISARRSIFTMAEEDIETRVNELGSFFTIRSSDASSVPMLLMQRLDEVHFKGTTRPITQTFYREFNGIPISWQPLYAPANVSRYPYGSILVSAETLEKFGDAYGEMFMTSRGVISISINDLAALIAQDVTGELTQDKVTAEALTKFKQVVVPLLPLHIVFDGMQLLIDVNIDAELNSEPILKSITDTVGILRFDAGRAYAADAHLQVKQEVASESEATFFWTPRFDDLPFDMMMDIDDVTQGI